MSRDLIERLRADAASSGEGYQCVCYVRTINEAADEITRLRAELSSLRGEGEHTVLEVFRAIMVANGDTDPGGASKGMFENLHPNERGYVEAVTAALASIPSTTIDSQPDRAGKSASVARSPQTLAGKE
jgi:hypothetical protein